MIVLNQLKGESDSLQFSLREVVKGISRYEKRVNEIESVAYALVNNEIQTRDKNNSFELSHSLISAIAEIFSTSSNESKNDIEAITRSSFNWLSINVPFYKNAFQPGFFIMSLPFSIIFHGVSNKLQGERAQEMTLIYQTEQKMLMGCIQEVQYLIDATTESRRRINSLITPTIPLIEIHNFKLENIKLDKNLFESLVTLVNALHISSIILTKNVDGLLTR